jgi:NitT/TauT family transport system permease protein
MSMSSKLSVGKYVPKPLRKVLPDWNARGALLRLLAVVVAIVLWDQYAATQPAYFFPTTEAIWEALLQQYRNEGLVSAFIGSMQTLAVGYAIAVVVGIPVGLLMGTNRYAEVLLNPYVTALYVAPIAAVVPLLIFALGASFETRVTIVFLFAVFEMIIDTYKGAKSTPADMIDVARSFGAGRLYVLRNVILPHDMPYIFTGLRLGIGRGLKGLVLAELLINFTNLGAIIRTWETNFQLRGVLSIALIFMLTGIVLTKAMQYVETRLFGWEDR